MLADIEMGDWRLDLVPNEQALHNVLASIRDMCMERPNINDMCVPNETLILQERFAVQRASTRLMKVVVVRTWSC